MSISVVKLNLHKQTDLVRYAIKAGIARLSPQRLPDLTSSGYILLPRVLRACVLDESHKERATGRDCSFENQAQKETRASRERLPL